MVQQCLSGLDRDLFRAFHSIFCDWLLMRPLIYRRDSLPEEDAVQLASFLGEQLRNLHVLPCPSLTLDKTYLDSELHKNTRVPAEWELSVGTLVKKKLDVSNRLKLW